MVTLLSDGYIIKRKVSVVLIHTEWKAHIHVPMTDLTAETHTPGGFQ